MILDSALTRIPNRPYKSKKWSHSVKFPDKAVCYLSNLLRNKGWRAQQPNSPNGLQWARSRFTHLDPYTESNLVWPDPGQPALPHCLSPVLPHRNSSLETTPPLCLHPNTGFHAQLWDTGSVLGNKVLPDSKNKAS